MGLKDLFREPSPISSRIGSILPLAALVALILYFVIIRFHGKLQHIPGPFLNSVSVLPRLLSVYRGHSHDDDLALHQKYGKIVRIAPKAVSVSDPTHLAQIYGISSNFFKSGFYEGVRFCDEEGILPDPFVLADKAMHRRMKRNAANAYALTALVQMEGMMDAVIERLFEHFDREFVTPARTCNLGMYMHYFSMDSIFTVTYGRDLDFISKGDEKGFCKTLQTGLFYMALVGQVPWAHKLLLGNEYVQRALGALGWGDSTMAEAMGIVTSQRALAEKTIILQEDDATGPCTFLERLMRNHSKNPGHINDREINTHAFGNITAGSDTTSTALIAILHLLIRHPEAADKLLQELRGAGLAGNKPAPYAVASKLPYLQAVIKESLRLHPSVGMMLARGVPASGATFRSKEGAEYHIGANVEIGINPWVIQRDPEVYPDPAAFVPERWLTASADHLSRMNQSWIPFGAGRHVCSGKEIAMLEIVKLIPSLLLRYSMTWEEGASDLLITNYFITIQHGLQVSMRKRQ